MKILFFLILAIPIFSFGECLLEKPILLTQPDLEKARLKLTEIQFFTQPKSSKLAPNLAPFSMDIARYMYKASNGYFDSPAMNFTNALDHDIYPNWVKEKFCLATIYHSNCSSYLIATDYSNNILSRGYTFSVIFNPFPAYPNGAADNYHASVHINKYNYITSIELWRWPVFKLDCSRSECKHQLTNESEELCVKSEKVELEEPPLQNLCIYHP